MKCQDCGNWVTQRKTVYGDDSEIVNYSSPSGKGRCEILNQDTIPEFGCLSFVPGEHVRVTHKPEPPWRYWTMISCPECSPKGGNGKCKCAGTSKVRRYDDGHIADEKRDRDHPKMKSLPVSEDRGTVLTLPKSDGIL